MDCLKDEGKNDKGGEQRFGITGDREEWKKFLEPKLMVRDTGPISRYEKSAVSRVIEIPGMGNMGAG